MSVAIAVREYLAGRPFLTEALTDGIINYAGLARKLRPDLEIMLDNPVNEGAIIMALKRIAPDYYFQVSKGIKSFLSRLGDFTVRSQINDYTYRNSKRLILRQKDLFERVVNHAGAFYSFNQGIHESTIVAKAVLDREILEILADETLLQRKTKLASITIILPLDNVEISGIYYFIFKQLAWEDINIVEVVSTTNEFTVVVAEPDIERSFQVLRKLKKGTI